MDLILVIACTVMLRVLASWVLPRLGAPSISEDELDRRLAALRRADSIETPEQRARREKGLQTILATEARHLMNDHPTLSDDVGQTVVWDRHSETTRVLQTSVESRMRSVRPSFLTAVLAVLVAVCGLAGSFIPTLSFQDFAIALPFVIVPGVIVLKWHLQVRRPHRFISFLRIPRRVTEWVDQVTHQSDLLDGRATALRDLIRRIRLVVGQVATERQVCENLHLFDAESKLDSLGRQLQDASNLAEDLAKLVTEGGMEARRFIASYRRAPREACSEYGQLPLVLDPERIEAVIDNLVLVLHRTTEVAVEVPWYIWCTQGKDSHISTGPAGKIAETVVGIFREVQGSSRSLKHQCRNMLWAFDSLHHLVATESIAALELGPASRMTARAAVAASVSTQPRARRPAARTAFVRAASASSNRSLIRIGKATVAAIKAGSEVSCAMSE